MPRRVTTLPADKESKPRDKNRAEHHADLLAGLANKLRPANASTDDADAYTIEEFCRKNRISVQLFYKYPHLMPDTFYIGKRRLVSREAGVRWRAARES